MEKEGVLFYSIILNFNIANLKYLIIKIMRKVYYSVIALIGLGASAQVGIGVPSENINASAQLEVASTTKGFLPPRMTQAQKNVITSPSPGLLVYQTDGTKGLYYYDGSAWAFASSTAATHTIGESFGGGIVFFVTPDGLHGLISETQLICPTANSAQNADIFNYSQAQNMISTPSNHSTNGKLYTDWRLPTKYEFALLFAQKLLFNTNYQGRLNYYNWTSTPGAVPNEATKMVGYFNGVPTEFGFNGGPAGVIAIRSF